MIKFDKFFITFKEKGLSQYQLYTYYDISRNQLQRLHQNKPASTITLNRLCKILQCNIQDICEYIEDENEELI